MSPSTPPSSPEPSPRSTRERAKSFVKSIRRKSSHLFRKHSDKAHSDKNLSPTVSALVGSHARSILLLSAPHDGERLIHSKSFSDSTTSSSRGSTSMLDVSVDEGEHYEEERTSVSDEPLAPELELGSGSGVLSGNADHTSFLPPMSADDEQAPTALSPPPVIVEPEVPDPFFVDDPEDPTSEAESTEGSTPQQSLAVPEEISLAQPSTSPTTSSPISERPLPPAPSQDSDEEEEEIPDLYLPGLTASTMFLPIPNTDPLTTLLNKYINSPDQRPVRDLSGEWQRDDFHTLVMTNSWRALARMARDRLVSTNPEELDKILPLWFLRLTCLARLRLFNQTSAECTNLFTVLNSIEPPSAKTWVFERLLPFELEVLQTRLRYWTGDYMGYLDALYAIFKKCKTRARQANSDVTVAAMWMERGSRICLMIASQFIEMKDFSAATAILEPLCRQEVGASATELRSAVGRIYLQAGLLDQALAQFSQVSEDPAVSLRIVEINAALMAAAEGDWTRSAEMLRRVVAADPEDFAAINNLSVALLSQGQLKEGIAVLEVALGHSPMTVVTAEPFLFNLSTLYELRSTIGMDKKRGLLVQVAAHSGDGLRTTCLKMPTA